MVQNCLFQCKLPFKWLAIETFEQKIFNTKTDVWSFGVVMWELFSLGDMPYADIANAQLHHRLSDGYRMSKPVNATQDIYDIMLQCWFVLPAKRPDFKQLLIRLSQNMPFNVVQVCTECRDRKTCDVFPKLTILNTHNRISSTTLMNTRN